MNTWKFNPERLTALRESKGMTQEDFARTINRIKQQVSMWETGKHDPSIVSLVDICNMHNVVPGYFFTQDGYNSSHKEVIGGERTD